VEGDRPAKVKAKLSSGHDAGLQSGKEFGVKERAYRAAQDAEMRRADPTLSGANAETVYRDKKGQKLDMLNEFMRKQAADESKEAKLKEAAELYGKGTAQQEGAVREAERIASMADVSFTRYADDAELEAAAKDVIHEEDPMAAYFIKKSAVKQQAVAAKAGRPVKPLYKGPTPPPNRFKIRPGYRWDGVDRSNGWEKKVLQASQKAIRT
jgi:pre-mRNA-splicing factor CWC26